MAKKKKRESTEKKSNKQSSRNCNSKKSSNSKKNSNSKENNKDNIKFSDFTYAELIVLAATLSYSLAEQLDEDDLAILLVFLGLLLTNIRVITTQKAIKAGPQAPNTELDLDFETEI
ncbi:hypothetical protein K0040_02430 [Terrisporobacter petrolearius]|uniref:hypothetical protein n=1 Tax=Terrisporobacter petrolearius TaxID=1460447 RepID=UPI001D16D63E|nr:hypothetical protein [Terrisporobacter petrolearius]MCC3863169.1 hypothetical protein [Terrisporobacter petrolearius]